MGEPAPGSPDFAEISALVADLGRTRSAAALLPRLVGALAGGGPEVALARVWVLRPGDICPSCPMQADCPDRTQCLHLAASAGASRADPGADWSGIDGAHRRFPVGTRKIGHVAATREALLVPDLEADATWISDLDWARREGIRAFAAWPLVTGGDLLGVLGLFLRVPLREAGGPGRLALVAEHAAVALATAQAFDEAARHRQRLDTENAYLRAEVGALHGSGRLVGRSAAARKCREQVDLVAPTKASVLIHGEPGTGKEVVARAIHDHGSGRDRPFVTLPCASVARGRFEAELFGEAGGPPGCLEVAGGGTLFLDQVGEVPLELQGRILRVLLEGSFERAGEERTRRVTLRILAATSRDLEADVEAGRFRRDVLYRLAVFPIDLVPLRDRLEDVAPLAEHFAGEAARQLGCAAIALDRRRLRDLEDHDWPGNVRELRNVVERATIAARCGREPRFDLPKPGRRKRVTTRPEPLPEGILTYAELKDRERMNVLAALEAARWKVSGRGGAAEILGIHPTTLASKIKAMKLVKGVGRA